MEQEARNEPPQSAQRRTAERRLQDLARRSRGDAEDQLIAPLAAAQQLWATGPQPSEIRIRWAFCRREQPLEGDIPEHGSARKERWPPASAAQSPRGISLRTALMLLFAAQVTASPARRARQGFWPVSVTAATPGSIGLVDLVAPLVEQLTDAYRRTTKDELRVRQVHSALNKLASPELSLVRLPPGTGYASERFARPSLLMETGPRREGAALSYNPPREGELTLELPVTLFLNGWVHLLTDSELLCWLMFRSHQASLGSGDPTALHLGAQERLAYYGLSKDVWDTHVSLGRMGLLSFQADPRRRADGTLDDFEEDGIGTRHRFAFHDKALESNALGPVSHAASEALNQLGVRESVRRLLTQHESKDSSMLS